MDNDNDTVGGYDVPVDPMASRHRTHELIHGSAEAPVHHEVTGVSCYQETARSAPSSTGGRS